MCLTEKCWWINMNIPFFLQVMVFWENPREESTSVETQQPWYLQPFFSILFPHFPQISAALSSFLLAENFRRFIRRLEVCTLRRARRPNKSLCSRNLPLKSLEGQEFSKHLAIIYNIICVYVYICNMYVYIYSNSQSAQLFPPSSWVRSQHHIGY